MIEEQRPGLEDFERNPLRAGYYLFDLALISVSRGESRWGFEYPDGDYFPEPSLANYCRWFRPVKVEREEIKTEGGEFIRLLSEEESELVKRTEKSISKQEVKV